MDTRFLRSFLCIAETGSLSRAAAELDIVQPALSRQIRILEEELDTQLLIRHRRGIALTEAGELLRAHATTIVAALDEARHAVSATGGKPSGRLAVGFPTSMLYVLSAELIHRYCDTYPRVSLEVFEAQAHIVEGYLREGRLDMAVLLSPKPIGGVALERLVSEHVHLVGPPGAGLAMDEPVKAEVVARLPMIMFPGHNKVRQAVEEALHRVGLDFTPRLEIEGQALTLALVRRGMGYTFLPQCAARAEIEAGRMCGAPIADAMVSWELGVQRVRAGAPAMKALIAMLRTSIARQLEDGVWRACPALAEVAPATTEKSKLQKTVARRRRSSSERVIGK